MARSGQPPPPPSFPKALTMRPLGIHVDPTGLHMVPIWVRTDPYAQAVHMACVPYGAVKNPRENPPPPLQQARGKSDRHPPPPR